MNPLKGRRLFLRSLTEEDAAALYAAVEFSRESLKRRLRWVAGVSAPEACRAFIRASCEASARGEGKAFAVVEARSAAIVGVASIQGMLAVPGLAEFSLWIRSDRHNQGYAAEAGRLLIAYALRRDVLHKLFARIDPANRPARKVLQKLGFRYEGCLRHEKRLNSRWIDQECWGLLRAERRS